MDKTLYLTMSTRFGIAIPTYNRANELRKRIEEILPQLTEHWSLWIYDNGSTDDTKSVTDQIKTENLIVKRSEINLGMCRNFGRCFEETECEWIWILGDDDPVTSNALSRIESILSANPDCAVVNFTTNSSCNPNQQLLKNLDDAFQFKDVTAFMHISSNIYNRKLIAASMHVLSQASFTYAPNVAIIFNVLGRSTNGVLLVPEAFLEDQDNPRRWSSLDVALGLSLFPEFISSARHRQIAAHTIRQSTRWMLTWGLIEAVESSQAVRWKALIRQIDGNLAAYGSTRLKGLHFLFRHSMADFKRELVIQLISHAPKGIILQLGKKMRSRVQKFMGTILKENQ